MQFGKMTEVCVRKTFFKKPLVGEMLFASFRLPQPKRGRESGSTKVRSAKKF